MTSTTSLSLIMSDLCRYHRRTDFRMLAISLLQNPGFRYSFLLRKTLACRDSKGMLATIGFVFYRILLNRYRYRYGFDISYRTNIGPGLYLGHFGGVVINRRAVIGRNVNIAQGVTIGQTYRGRKAGVPVIG